MKVIGQLINKDDCNISSKHTVRTKPVIIWVIWEHSHPAGTYGFIYIVCAKKATAMSAYVVGLMLRSMSKQGDKTISPHIPRIPLRATSQRV